jgi:hypothetical protein
MPQRLEDKASQSRNNLISDGIYEEINFKMVFLVKDSKIYRLLWNHVKGSGIISREIESVSNYLIREGVRDDNILLTNGFVFKKINTDKNNVNDRVKKLYHENVKYLNKKFNKRSPSEDTEPLTEKTDGSPDVPSIIDSTHDINRNSEEYQRLINDLSEQQTLISKLQQQSDAYRDAGLEIIEQFKSANRASTDRGDVIHQYQEYIRSKQSEMSENDRKLRDHLKLYDKKLKEAHDKNNQLHELIRIDTEIHRLQESSAYARGQEQAQAQARSGARGQVRRQARASGQRLGNPPGDKNEELVRRSKQLAFFSERNRSLGMENQVLRDRLEEVNILLQVDNPSGGSGEEARLLQIIEQITGDKSASEERRAREIEIIRQEKKLQGEEIQSLHVELNRISKMLEVKNSELAESEERSRGAGSDGSLRDNLEACNIKLQQIEAENQQFRQDIYSKDRECEGARHRQAEQFDVEMESQGRNYQRQLQQLREQLQQLHEQYQQLQLQLHQQGQQGPPASTFSPLHTPIGSHPPGGISGPPPPQYDSSSSQNPSLIYRSTAPSDSMTSSAPVVHPIASQVAPGASGVDKPAIDSCQ